MGEVPLYSETRNDRCVVCGRELGEVGVRGGYKYKRAGADTDKKSEPRQ